MVGARPQFIKAAALAASQPRPLLYGDGHAAEAIVARLSLYAAYTSKTLKMESVWKHS